VTTFSPSAMMEMVIATPGAGLNMVVTTVDIVVGELWGSFGGGSFGGSFGGSEVGERSRGALGGAKCGGAK
jgi:hypothetical protein